MDKVELIKNLCKEAERVVRVRMKLTQWAFAFMLLVVSHFTLVLIKVYPETHSLIVDCWPLYFGYFVILIIIYFILPFGKISQKKVEKVFDEIIFERSQSYIDVINKMNEKLAGEQRELNELNKKSDLLIEIISENS